jgi:leader peptidase (prepilin peptidase)/N-methyltransferase
MTQGLISSARSRALYLMWPFLVFLGLGFFLIGTVVGSFLNVCIYRIPWQKSVIWPSSRCPNCYSAIAARDNIPIVSWFALRGECRSCGAPIAVRYPLVEALVGCLFLGTYLLDVIAAPRTYWGEIPAFQLLTAAYHCVFLALLVAATFIDYDFLLIPDQITVTGMVFGIALGTIWPLMRPAPASWPGITHVQGFWVGALGLAVGAGLTQVVRKGAGFVFRREAMGFGDVTLMAMIGGFMGWQAAVLTFFVGPILGLVHAVLKLLKLLQKWLRGGQLSSADRELPLGPYLSMAAATLFFSWPWLWPRAYGFFFRPLYVIFWWLLGIDVDLPA